MFQINIILTHLLFLIYYLIGLAHKAVNDPRTNMGDMEQANNTTTGGLRG
jgi:hypothetical protein